MCHTLIFVLKKKKYFFHRFDPFLDIFFNPPWHQRIKDIGLIFFSMSWPGLKNWAMNMHFIPIPILSGLFLGGEAPNAPPQAIHKFRPPDVS